MILYVDHVVPPTHFTCKVIGASMILQPHLKKTTQNKTKKKKQQQQQNKIKQNKKQQNKNKKQKKNTAQLWLYKRQL